MRTTIRRPVTSLAATLTVFAMFRKTASAAEPTPGTGDLDTVISDQQGSGYFDFSALSELPWIWQILAVVLGALVLAILIWGGISGGVKLGFAGNNKDSAREAMMKIKHALGGVGVIVVTSVAGLSIFALLLGFVV